MKLYVNLNFLGIMNIKMYPYGNAHEEKLPNGHYAYDCQHGEKECRGKYHNHPIFLKVYHFMFHFMSSLVTWDIVILALK